MYVLCPCERVVQGLQRASDEWCWRVGVAGDPPPDWDPHCIKAVCRHESEVAFHDICAPVVLSTIYGINELEVQE
jgi:hypothetical protein